MGRDVKGGWYISYSEGVSAIRDCRDGIEGTGWGVGTGGMTSVERMRIDGSWRTEYFRVACFGLLFLAVITQTPWESRPAYKLPQRASAVRGIPDVRYLSAVFVCVTRFAGLVHNSCADGRCRALRPVLRAPLRSDRGAERGQPREHGRPGRDRDLEPCLHAGELSDLGASSPRSSGCVFLVVRGWRVRADLASAADSDSESLSHPCGDPDSRSKPSFLC